MRRQKFVRSSSQLGVFHRKKLDKIRHATWFRKMISSIGRHISFIWSKTICLNDKCGNQCLKSGRLSWIECGSPVFETSNLLCMTMWFGAEPSLPVRRDCLRWIPLPAKTLSSLRTNKTQRARVNARSHKNGFTREIVTCLIWSHAWICLARPLIIWDIRPICRF